MIKTVIAILGAICALTPNLACVKLTSAEQSPLCETRYSSDFQGGTFDRTTYVKTNYSRREIEEYENPYKVPTFGSNAVAACTVDAGGNAIVYYDRLCGDLVIGYSATTFLGSFNYGKQNTAVSNMFTELYGLMGAGDKGTTINGFKTGMTTYVNQKGYSINLTQSTGSYNNINFEYLKEQLQQEKVAVIFLNTYSIVASEDFSTGNGYDEVRHNLYNGNHAMLIYGYADYFYYDDKGSLIDRITYLHVNTDNDSILLAYLDISNYCNVDDIYIVDIY